MTGAPPKVFISYSHDTVAHQERVLGFADRLRADGIDGEIDQYNAAPPDGWPLWCERQISAADVVLMICTETYHRRVKGDEEQGKGLGVVWEARIIRQLLYDAGAISAKFVPVLFSDASPEQIPTPIKGWARYVVDTEDGYEELYRRLTGQPRFLRPTLGTIRPLPTRRRQWPEGTMQAASSSPDIIVTTEQAKAQLLESQATQNGPVSTETKTEKPPTKAVWARLRAHLRLPNRQTLFSNKAIIIVGVSVVLVASLLLLIPSNVTPQQVAEQYSQSTVVVNNVWRLYDQVSGNQVFHKCMPFDFDNDGQQEMLPGYVKIKDPLKKETRIVRWLTTEGDPATDQPVSQLVRGSGFVVSNDGFILTNKHVAAAWQVKYEYTNYELEQRGILVEMQSYAKSYDKRGFNPTEIQDLATWVPADGAWLFRGDHPIPRAPFYEREAPLEGREVLDVLFHGNTNSAKARLIRWSQSADVSLIKVDVARPLQSVKLAPRDYMPRVGEPVTVLGYPAITPGKVQLSVEAVRRRTEAVPGPTVTAGYISNVTTAGSMGDVYMLTDLATGAGNSGGPVFNGAGNVVGLFTYLLSDRDVRETLAVPIKYGHELF